MHILRTPIATDTSIQLWWTTALEQTPFLSEPATFQAEVNTGEAYVQIVYPVREAFLKNHNLATIPYPDLPFNTLYLPFENKKVDFSTFIHTPHHLQCAAKTWIEVEDRDVYRFDIYTCGAVKLWVDGKVVLCFSPFTRNIAQKQRLDLPLSKGSHELVVYAEELAERDVFFYFEIRYKSRNKLINAIEIAQDPDLLQKGMDLLKSLWYEQDLFRSGPVQLHYDPTFLPESNCTLKLEGSEKALTLNRDKDSVSYGDVGQLPYGIFRHCYQLAIDQLVLKRTLLVGFLDQRKSVLEELPTLAGRKQQALTFLDADPEASITGALVLLQRKHLFTDGVQKRLEISLAAIERKDDCSDFHLVPLLLFYKRCGDLLPTAQKQRIEQVLCSFRYWFDEPGNDVMWFFSENHALLFHIGQYLSGHLFPDARFSTSNRNGIEQYELGKKRLFAWFEMFFRYGYAEWNSATYLPIDLLGFFVLYELAVDAEIRALTKQALDFTFRLIAHNSFHGVMSASFGRAYEDTLKFRSQTELSFIYHIAFGSGFYTKAGRATTLFALSSYEPEPYHRETMLNNDEWMEITLRQGIRNVDTYLFKTPYYQMGCVQQYRPFTHGHQQHLFNVAAGRNAELQYFINHPGEPAFSGQNRPSYWAGNGTMPSIHQYRNIALLLYHIDAEELVHAIHAYAPQSEMDQMVVDAHHVFMAKDDAYIATWFSNPFTCTSTGANSKREILSQGLIHGVVVRAAGCKEFSDFSAFMADQQKQNYSFNPETLHLTCTDSRYGLVEATPNQLIVQGSAVVFDYAFEPHIQKGRFSKL